MKKLENIDLDIIYDFIENGDPTSADPEIVAYLELMDKVRGMYLRFDRYGSKDHIIKHLMKVEKLTRYLATKIYNETLEYFYCEQKISKDAWRNIYAEKMERLINLASLSVKDVTDMDRVSKMIERVSSLRQLDKEDKEDLPMEFFQKPWKIYTLDIEQIEGMQKVDRTRLGKIIDALPEVSEKEIEIIKRDAMLLAPKIFRDEQENSH